MYEYLVQEMLGKYTGDQKYDRCVKEGIDFTAYLKAEFDYSMAQYKNKVGGKYAYFITFTLKPSADEEHAQKLIDDTINRQEALGLLEMRYVKEHTKAGQAHWHCYVRSTKPIKKDRFNYYIKKCGNIDIKSAKSKDAREIENYMLKEADEIKVLI